MAEPMAYRKVTFLASEGARESSSHFEVVTPGVIVEVGGESEILIPWHRVLEIWDGRGCIPRI